MPSRPTIIPLACLFLLSPLPSIGQDAGPPLSAIDWLSNSIALPEEKTEASADIPAITAPPDVIVAPLGAPVLDRVGLLDADQLDLPRDLWGSSTAADIARRISNVPETENSELRFFFRSLLVVRLDPPVDAIADDSLFLARVDKLLAMGDLETAEDLIVAAGEPEPHLFRRAFDIALLRETETDACLEISETPDLSPTFPTRIFCLARNGEWEVAALTLGTAEALDLLEGDEEALLLRFLDPELFEGDPLPPPPPVPSPLSFRLYEAVGERIDTDSLPLAFARADLSENVGWRTRLRATERLARAGVLSAEDLITEFTSRAPAASGGIWDRVASLQNLVATLSDGDMEGVAQALPAAWAHARDAGYGPTLAPWLAAHFAGMTLTGDPQHDVFEIALLAGDTDLAARHVGRSSEDRTLLALALGNISEMEGTSPLFLSVKRALSGLAPRDRFKALVDDGRKGEALLAAITQLAEGADGDPAAIGDALALLVAMGQRQAAERIALELLLAEGLA